MSRYVAIAPRAWSSATHMVEDRPICTVWETENEPVNTGLLNADGHPLYRMPEPKRIGFIVRGDS